MNDGIVLVPLDGSEAARAALPVASALGKAFGASLRIAHVNLEARAPLPELAERLGVRGAALDAWSIEAQVGEPSQVILEMAQELDTRFIVICARTSDRPGDLLGRTALSVLQGAACDVVLVPPRRKFQSWSARRILAPYDGSAEGEAAVALAADLALHTGAEIILLQVGVAGMRAPERRGALGMPRYMDQPHHEWANWSGELLDRLACLCPGGQLRAGVKVRSGDPGPEILQVARDDDADLIALGWKGVWNDEHARTLKAVLRDARCPLAIARVSAGIGRPSV